MSKLLLFISFVFLLLGNSTSAHSNDYQKRAVQTLDEVWKLVKKQYYDEKLKQIDWQAKYDEYLPKIKACKSDLEVAVTLNYMLSVFKESHTMILPPVSLKYKKAIAISKDIKKENSDTRSGNETKKERSQPVSKTLSNVPGGVGVKLCIADNNICIQWIKKGSSSYKAGIKPGNILKSINNYEFSADEFSDFPWDMIAESMLLGRAGKTVVLGIEDNSGNHKNINLELTPTGSTWIKLGAMPTTTGRFYDELLEDKIGYIYFSPSFTPQILKFQQSIKKFSGKANALIIDLRNNPGGLMQMPQGITGWFTDKSYLMGTMKTRNANLVLRSFPQPSAFKGPVAVLVNGGSASSVEVFAAGFQDNKLGKVFGETTMGKCLPSKFLILSTGFRFQTVFGDLKRINGKKIEGIGVTPDVVIKMDRKSLIQGIDPVLKAAKQFLIKKVSDCNNKLNDNNL